MTDTTHQVVSMIAGENDLKMITLDAGVIHMNDSSTYDMAKLIEDITPQLSGGNVVSVNLTDYMSINKALTDQEFEDNGIMINHKVNGQMVQGIFYPQKVAVQVQESPDVEPVTIPNVENLEAHINRAASENSPAVRNFLKRLAPVVRERKHSAEDLMNFIKRCEMPLTHDGRIIGYKRVNQGKVKGEFVDCHSGNITQRVGSRVFMDIDGVDPDRNRSCSHGLHVANLGYMRGFVGSHVLMVLVDPADFIAVPRGEDTKCRVCSYDIFGIVSGSAQTVVESSGVPEDATFDSLVKSAIEGTAVRPDEMVKVGTKTVLERRPITQEELKDPMLLILEGAKEDVVASPKSLTKDEIKQEASKQTAQEALKEAKDSTAQKWLKAPENVQKAFRLLASKGFSKSVIAKKLETSTRSIGRWMEKYDFAGYQAYKSTGGSVKELAMSLYQAKQWDDLLAFKKAKKKGWRAFGFDTKQIEVIMNKTSNK